MDTPELQPPDACYGFEGNSDLYGIGIRIGVYLSWAASVVAALLADRHHNIVDELSDVNTTFILANVIAVIFSAAQRTISSTSDGIFPVDPRKTLWFRFNDSFSRAGSLMRFGIALATASFSAWFAFVGADTLRGEECDYPVFLFGSYSLFGPVRTFLKLYSVLVCIVLGLTYTPVFLLQCPNLIEVVTSSQFRYVLGTFCCFFFCAPCIVRINREDGQGRRRHYAVCFKFVFCLSSTFLKCISFTTNMPREMTSNDLESLQKPTREHVRQCCGSRVDEALFSHDRCIASVLRNHNIILGFIGLATSVLALIVIELTIKLNGIQGVNELAQTSQLIPFIAGCALFLGITRKVIFQEADRFVCPMALIQRYFFGTKADHSLPTLV
ncbi:hypothetical protein B0T25DRAFT_446025 [Lasiosphaeria hispida]|uniref:Uncharacterized protein n=1 Tax=Lasiosphaeria hispida TaxID=260671 RepID=A0AAJ0MKP5_9PEZI|nr:hypothetical protein B0T25DRAFT_446025 [Lasiosphaeria hispida]